jgi:hypothetical protein
MSERDRVAPLVDLMWLAPWHFVDGEHARGLQRELLAEVGPLHPLWGKEPMVFGRAGWNDDIVVQTSDGRFAIVHLVWHGKIDQVPDRYPSTEFLENLDELQQFVYSEHEAFESPAY